MASEGSIRSAASIRCSSASTRSCSSGPRTPARSAWPTSSDAFRGRSRSWLLATALSWVFFRTAGRGALDRHPGRSGLPALRPRRPLNVPTQVVNGAWLAIMVDRARGGVRSADAGWSASIPRLSPARGHPRRDQPRARSSRLQVGGGPRRQPVLAGGRALPTTTDGRQARRVLARLRPVRLRPLPSSSSSGSPTR